LLFTGIEGVGKQAAAIELARACNCTEKNSGRTPELETSRGNIDDRNGDLKVSVGPCGICNSCRKISAGIHPDIILVKPTGPIIKIAQVRELCNTLAMKPYEANTRVVIIQDAQTMNPAAGNALLKILEEPPQRTILILVATRSQDLLPTIVSRCQQLRFNPISREKLELLLVEKHGFDPQDAGALAVMAHGSLSRATAMYEANWINRRSWILQEMSELSSRSINSILAFAQQLSKEKEAILESLEVMKSWMRDLVIAAYDPGKILNQDKADEIQQAAKKMSIAVSLSKMDLVQKTQNRIRANANVRLALEVLLIKLAGHEQHEMRR
jgi:DNA polymerase-3 subunit delta'